MTTDRMADYSEFDNLFHDPKLSNKKKRNLRPEASLAAARCEALEEARQMLRDLRMAWIEQYGETTAWDSGHCSAYAKAEDAIRALIEKEE